MSAARLALALALAASSTACSAISDFDFAFDDDDAGPAFDGGGEGDAGPAFDAGDLDAGPELDAGAQADAGAPVVNCPMPCLGDAVVQWTGEPGVGDLEWRYHEDPRSGAGLVYPDLAFDETGLRGFKNPTGDTVIARCADNAGASECAGIADYLYVAGPAPGAPGADPVIGFRALSRAVLRVQGRVRLPDGVSTAETHRIVVSRNARFDAAAVERVVPTTAPTDFDFLVDVLPGDGLLVRFDQVSGGSPLALGVQLWVTRMDAPLEDRCLLGLTFDEGMDGLLEQCNDFMVENENDGLTGPGGLSSRGPGPSPRLGDARVFEEGQYLVAASAPLDFAGDFTVQLWGNVDAASRFGHSLYADSTTDGPVGGVSFIMDGGDGFVRTFYARGASPCTEATAGICVEDPALGAVSNDEWHFWRLVRRAGENEIEVCIDGARRARATVPGSEDQTSAYPPHIARNVTFNPAYLQGSIDDVRAYDVALPCGL